MPRSETIRAAWITGGLGAIGAIIGAIVTGGFGLIHPTPTPTPAPTIPTAPVTPVSTTNPATVPTSYEGTWNGVVTQSNGSSFQLTLKIGSGGIGTDIGSWQLPTFNCSGVLTLESGGGPLQFLQDTTFNGVGECYSHFTANVDLQGSDLNYEIIGATTISGQFFSGDLASGNLSES